MGTNGNAASSWSLSEGEADGEQGGGCPLPFCSSVGWLMRCSGRSAWSSLPATMAAAALSSSLRNRRRNELGWSWVKERGRLQSRGSFECFNVHTWQRPSVVAREVACGDSRDATRPGAQHFSAWRVRALKQVAGIAAAMDGARQQSCSERAPKEK
jgi:hypothetical protein